MPESPNPQNVSDLASKMAAMGQSMGDNIGGKLMTHAGSALGGLKNKDAPADMSQVPMATGSFYQPMQSDARSQLLQTMMQRSRMGRNQGA